MNTVGGRWGKNRIQESGFGIQEVKGQVTEGRGGGNSELRIALLLVGTAWRLLLARWSVLE
jgi:hypothetical protein